MPHSPLSSSVATTTLTVWSPAGVVAVPAAVRRGVERLRQHGFVVNTDPSALARHQRFAGDDTRRLAALHRVAEAAPGVAMATRGGYGLMRLLDAVDWSLLARSVERGTRWVGYSDCTLLQLAALAHGAGGSDRSARDVGGFWHGPMVCEDWGRDAASGGVDEVTEGCFLEAMAGELEAVGFKTDPGFDGLAVRGRLWGGNLTLLTALLGTRHVPKIKGGILFLEDVNEHPYRVERHLLQLHQAGILEAQKAVVLGHFSSWKPSPLDRGYTLKTAVAYLRSVCKTPLLTGLPFGHVPTKVSLPQGRRTELVVDGRNVFLFW